MNRQTVDVEFEITLWCETCAKYHDRAVTAQVTLETSRSTQHDDPPHGQDVDNITIMNIESGETIEFDNLSPDMQFLITEKAIDKAVWKYTHDNI